MDVTFYGGNNPKAISYLEFGSIDLAQGKKEVWDFRLHQKAYDWLMCARYANDIWAYQTLTDMLHSAPADELLRFYSAEVFHQNDAALHLSKLIALSAADCPEPTLHELGHTLFGCIDAAEMLSMWCELRGYNFGFSLRSVNWYGTDISPLFNLLSRQMHSDYRTTTGLPGTYEVPRRVDVFFAKGVTLLYAFRDPRELAESVANGKIGIWDYSFTMNQMQSGLLGTGKEVTYLPATATIECLHELGCEVYTRRAKLRRNDKNCRIYCEMLTGDRGQVERYMHTERALRATCVSDELGRVWTGYEPNGDSAWMKITHPKQLWE